MDKARKIKIALWIMSAVWIFIASILLVFVFLCGDNRAAQEAVDPFIHAYVYAIFPFLFLAWFMQNRARKAEHEAKKGLSESRETI